MCGLRRCSLLLPQIHTVHASRTIQVPITIITDQKSAMFSRNDACRQAVDRGRIKKRNTTDGTKFFIHKSFFSFSGAAKPPNVKISTASPRAKRPRRLPVALSNAEARSVLSNLHGEMRLIVSLLYGSGLRLMEGIKPRVKDLDSGELAIEF